jgi:hypothetical protein
MCFTRRKMKYDGFKMVASLNNKRTLPRFETNNKHLHLTPSWHPHPLPSQRGETHSLRGGGRGTQVRRKDRLSGTLSDPHTFALPQGAGILFTYKECRLLHSLRDFAHVGVFVHLVIYQQLQQVGSPEARSWAASCQGRRYKMARPSEYKSAVLPKPRCIVNDLKEVLRRENQGLKVYPVDGSSVFSMTGTYFWFVLSMLSGLI